MIFLFSKKKTILKKNEIVQSIINDQKFLLQKNENDYIDPMPQTVAEIENETSQDKKDYLQTA